MRGEPITIVSGEHVFHSYVAEWLGGGEFRTYDGRGSDNTVLPPYTLSINDEGRTWLRGRHENDSLAVRALRTVYALSTPTRRPIVCGECGSSMEWYGYEGVYVCSNNECGAQSP